MLIKANLSFPIPPDESPDTTHPEVIAALIKVFNEGERRELSLVTNQFGVSRTRDTCKITGIEEVVKKMDGELCYFDAIQSYPHIRIHFWIN